MAISVIGQMPKMPKLSDSFENQGENKVSGFENFGEVLKKVMEDTNSLQVDSKKSSDNFVAGITDNLHQVMIAGEKAEVAMALTMQIRTKVLEAYNEVMRMQI